MSRHFSNVKPALDQHQLSAIILCAGEGRRMRSFGSKSLVKIDNKTLINHQIEIIKNKFPRIGEIIVVVGYESEKIIRQLIPNVKVVENEKYSDNSALRSLNMGLRICTTQNIVVVHGDILFDQSSLDFTTFSALILDNHGRISDDKVGATINASKELVILDYGLESKFGQCVFFTGKELELLRKFCKDRTKDSLCTFEILNYIVNKGGTFKCIELDKKSLLKEFDSIGDINEFEYLEGDIKLKL